MLHWELATEGEQSRLKDEIFEIVMGYAEDMLGDECEPECLTELWLALAECLDQHKVS